MEITIEFQPHRTQKIVMDALDDPDYRFITLITSRQWGKSKLIQIQALKWALSKPKMVVWIVSPTESQVAKIFEEMFSPLMESGIVKSKSESSGELFIKFTNNSIIEFKSSRSEDNLRGNTLDYLILDEFCFIKEATYKKILLPTLITRPNSKVFLASTPLGRGNWGYTQFKLKGDKYKSFRFTYKDNPLIDLDLIEEYKRTMSETQFAQEFLAEFVDQSTLFSNIRECEISEDEITPYTKCYGGIDLGLVNDNSVFTIVNEYGEVVFQDAFTGLEVNDLIDRLDRTFQKYQPEKVYVETNSFGLVVLQMLRELWFEKVAGFNTSNKSKSDIISNLISAFSTKSIRFVENQSLIDELNDFGYKLSPTGQIQYASLTSTDDRIMSLAITWFCYNRRHSIGSVPIQF